MSLESSPSNSVMVESPLPSGWYRFYDLNLQRYYYANMRINASSWVRPETDPWFLEESIIFNFEPREIKTLKALFIEDIAHFSKVSVEQFMDVLREIGERCSKTWIARLFKGYSGNIDIVEWKHFMEVVDHIKKYRIASDNVVANPFELVYLFISKFRIKSILKPKTEKLGHWVIEYSSLADKQFYRNTLTNETHWSMPSDVRFYIPPKLETKLLSVFDYGDIEEFQQYFALLDIDSSGDLNGKEIRLLLKSLGIEISDSKFNRLLNTIDLNGNGTIEFDEYCWMMYQLYQSDNNSSFWKEIKMSKKTNPNPNSNVVQQSEDSSNNNEADSVSDGNSFKSRSRNFSIFNDNDIQDKLSYASIRGTLGALKMLGTHSRSTATGGMSMRGSLRRTMVVANSKKRKTTTKSSCLLSYNSFFCCCDSSSSTSGGVVVPVVDIYNKSTHQLQGTGVTASSVSVAVSGLNSVLSKFDEANLDELSITSSNASPVGKIQERRKSRITMLNGGELNISNHNSNNNDDVSLYDNNDDMSTSNHRNRSSSSSKSRRPGSSIKSQIKSKHSKKHQTNNNNNNDDNGGTSYDEDELDEKFNSAKVFQNNTSNSNNSNSSINQIITHGKFCMCGCRSY